MQEREGAEAKAGGTQAALLRCQPLPDPPSPRQPRARPARASALDPNGRSRAHGLFTSSAARARSPRPPRAPIGPALAARGGRGAPEQGRAETAAGGSARRTGPGWAGLRTARRACPSTQGPARHFTRAAEHTSLPALASLICVCDTRIG